MPSEKSQNVEIDIPSITYLLIVGSSDSSLSFSANIQNIGYFDKVFHVETVTQASNLLLRVKFGVVVVDGDDIDPVSFSRIIRLYDSLARIIVISSNVKLSEMVELKNVGSIHGFLEIPIDDMMAHTLVVKQQAQYQVNLMLSTLIANPPKFTPAYNLLHDPGSREEDKKFEILACAIVRDTIPIFEHFFETVTMDIDTVLLSGYLSAIAILGKKLFENREYFEEISFEGISIYFHFVENLQYIYFVSNVTRENYDKVEKIIKRASNHVYLNHKRTLLNLSVLTESEHSKIVKIIKKYLPDEKLSENAMEVDRKPEIINYGMAEDNIMEFYDLTERVYNVHYIPRSEDQLIDIIRDRNIDLVFVNGYETQNIELLNSMESIKEITPSAQIIANLESLEKSHLIEILNTPTIDYIFTPLHNTDKLFKLTKEAINKSRKIKKSSIFNDEILYRQTYEQTNVIKEMLRKYNLKFDKSSIPDLYGIYILQNGEKFLSHYWLEDGYTLISDDELFAGFISSLVNLTTEFTGSLASFSGVKFGDANIMIERPVDIEYKFHITIVYLLGNLDATNYDQIKKNITYTSNKIFNIFAAEKDQKDIDSDILDLGNNLREKLAQIRE